MKIDLHYNFFLFIQMEINLSVNFMFDNDDDDDKNIIFDNFFFVGQREKRKHISKMFSVDWRFFGLFSRVFSSSSMCAIVRK